MKGEPREMTHEERAAVKKLAASLCANYDRGRGCLPLDGSCYMFGKCWTGGYCRYFREAVLPSDPELETALTGLVAPTVSKRPCAICGKLFPVNGKQAYCSSFCANDAKKKLQRGYMRVKRGEC